jgi:hypothetical protein
MLMSHKFDANASNLVLMPKKTSGGGYYNFIFFLNHVLCKIGRTLGEPTGRTPSIFLKKINSVYSKWKKKAKFWFETIGAAG